MWYPKIPQRFGDGPLPGGSRVAEEKVHGAHLALVSDGRTARAAGRRGLLDEDRLEGFFGVTRLWPVLATAAAAAARAAGQDLILYGELAGGGYPHPQVTPVEGIGPVQTGVWYCPDLVWLAFDGAVATSPGPPWLLAAAVERLTPPRADAARSKLGPPPTRPSWLPRWWPTYWPTLMTTWAAYPDPITNAWPPRSRPRPARWPPFKTTEPAVLDPRTTSRRCEQKRPETPRGQR
ncbi:hypothetical protein [Actinomadura geliboluensis]|uniref:hypothetical protein n=1 Tax=Actinomadura geliboluensis TaxID=882440 RepID=UPI0026307E32|nr:hypothetical protein [Actinomadura geliboluensis]